MQYNLTIVSTPATGGDSYYSLAVAEYPLQSGKEEKN